jgi:hypothetical protein
LSFQEDDRAMMTPAGMSLGERDPVREARPRWPRRLLVGLWLLVFASAGTGVALSWDRIVDTLTRRPAPTTPSDPQASAPGVQP